MTAWKPHSFSEMLATCLLVVLCAQSSALARGSGSRDEPWSAERIGRLPPEVRDSVNQMCSVKPTAAHYFVTYLDNARIVKLHFEYFHCDGAQMYRDAGRCLRKEFIASGSHYQLLRNYYGECGD